MAYALGIRKLQMYEKKGNNSSIDGGVFVLGNTSVISTLLGFVRMTFVRGKMMSDGGGFRMGMPARRLVVRDDGFLTKLRDKYAFRNYVVFYGTSSLPPYYLLTISILI